MQDGHLHVRRDPLHRPVLARDLVDLLGHLVEHVPRVDDRYPRVLVPLWLPEGLRQHAANVGPQGERVPDLPGASDDDGRRFGVGAYKQGHDVIKEPACDASPACAR